MWCWLLQAGKRACEKVLSKGKCNSKNFSHQLCGLRRRCKMRQVDGVGLTRFWGCSEMLSQCRIGEIGKALSSGRAVMNF